MTSHENRIATGELWQQTLLKVLPNSYFVEFNKSKHSQTPISSISSISSSSTRVSVVISVFFFSQVHFLCLLHLVFQSLLGATSSDSTKPNKRGSSFDTFIPKTLLPSHLVNIDFILIRTYSLSSAAICALRPLRDTQL
jgi:hypothetical protein